ncbi:MAG: type II toxin-antitoxin system RelE/ParE family toxin [Chloroflexi bacterium]|nr:type II toxin-antitoxin system RelE/ParE family toxin [Chloroflexota bacterium]
MNVVWTDAALGHLQAIHDYIARNSETYAQRMVDRVTKRSEQIGLFPLSGRMYFTLLALLDFAVFTPYNSVYFIPSLRGLQR